MIPTQVSRQRLYEELWASPARTVAERYGLTSGQLRHICLERRVPKPEAGYWSKKRFGKAAAVPPLEPSVHPDGDLIPLLPTDSPLVRLGRKRRWARDKEIDGLMAAERTGPRIEVPGQLSNPHPLVAATIRFDRKDGAGRQKRSLANGAWEFFTPEPRAKVSAVASTPALLARAYRIMNSLIKALEARGHEVVAEPTVGAPVTVLNMLGCSFSFRVYEPLTVVPHALTPDERREKKRFGAGWIRKNDYAPSGKLWLQLLSDNSYVLAQFKDGEPVKVEDRLNDFVIAALVRVDEARQLDLWRQRRAEAQAENERKEQEALAAKRRIEEERQREQQRTDGLLAQVRAWRASQDIRAFIAAVQRLHDAAQRTIEPGSELDSWMAWARGVADRMDPLTPTQPMG